MIFSSYRFIFGFFPIVFAVFCVLRAAKKPYLMKIWLILASLAFYAIGQRDFFAVFLGSVLFNYLMIRIIARHKDKKWIKLTALLLSVTENIGLLVYFKYTNFIIENINRLTRSEIGALSLILPIGISFFTFQLLASVVSAYRGELDTPNIVDYMLFITFFPQLIVGPVVLHDELLPQLEGDRLLNYSKNDIMRGVLLFSIGASKKIILANPMINYATEFYSGDIASSGAVEAWIGVIAFTFAYYFDFSGYIDMARGLGLLFGIKLPINFDSPYKAVDFADFWRRWNITVSRFFNDSVFNNLFGFGDRIPKLIFATLATFLVSGIWHGAAWHFIIWGLVCGVLVAVSNVMTLYRVKIPKVLGISVTFVVMMLVRVLFDAECMTDAVAVYGKLFSLDGGLSGALNVIRENLYVIGIIIISFAVCFFFGNANSLCSEKGEESRPLAAYEI
ncbi:MAG: MBOAT family O-acyltransferase, partial [Clostridia bacterium]|nr:MBOAT family O-acyltransferase [Clostridia bacterium]